MTTPDEYALFVDQNVGYVEIVQPERVVRLGNDYVTYRVPTCSDFRVKAVATREFDEWATQNSIPYSLKIGKGNLISVSLKTVNDYALVKLRWL